MRLTSVTAAIVLAMTLVVLSEDIFLCNKCGYENEKEATVCTHCKAALSPVKKDPKPSVSESPVVKGSTFSKSGKLQYLAPKVVEDEIEHARKEIANKDVEVGKLFLRNARALEYLTDPGVESTRTKVIFALVKGCESNAVVSGSTVKCPVCDGSGKTMMKVQSLTGEVSYLEMPSRPCPKCSGKGEIVRGATVDDLKTRLGQAMKRYRDIQDSRKYVSNGGAWIPFDLEQKLTIRQSALLRKGVAAKCPACMGSGLVDCTTCKGLGIVKCPVAKCNRGMVEVFTDKAIVDTLKVLRTEKCKTCGGSGSISCGQCKGVGGTVCGKCSGSGDRPDCTKCDGKGFTSCKKCNGAGSAGDVPCTVCGGDGASLCTYCSGDGKSSK